MILVLHLVVETKLDAKNIEVRILCDAGRILRPLLVVDNLKKIKVVKGDDYSFQTLLDKGIIKLIGAEEEDCRTAWGIKYLFSGEKGKDLGKYTHCEIDMSFLLGVSCVIIHLYSTIMQGGLFTNPRSTLGKLLDFPLPTLTLESTPYHIKCITLRNLFSGLRSDSLGKPGYPLGRNQILPKAEFFNRQTAIVAVNVHQWYNQEDSIVMDL